LPISGGAFDFPQVVRAAGTIFSGTVTSIARHPATRGQAVETVAITFHIENAIRGATSGEDLTVFAMDWPVVGGQRYRLGERVLLFLYPPSKLGLTSCVAGSVGRFTIDAQGRIVLSAQHLSAFRSSPILRGKSRLRLSDGSAFQPVIVRGCGLLFGAEPGDGGGCDVSDYCLTTGRSPGTGIDAETDFTNPPPP
jgi:hypothetical protein